MKIKRLHIGVLILMVVCALGFLIPHVHACVRYAQSTRMIAAIRADDVDAVRAMLESDVSPNVPNGPYKGLWKYLNAFVESSPDCPLSVACEEGNLEMVKLLLAYGADPAVTEQDGVGWSALCSAVLASEHEQSAEIVRILIDHGANIAPGGDGYLPIELVCMDYSALESGTEKGKAHAERIVEIAQMVIGEYDVNAGQGYTLLMHAARDNNKPLVEYLLSVGADPNVQTSDGETAYDVAMKHDHQDIAEILKTAMEASTAD